MRSFLLRMLAVLLFAQPLLAEEALEDVPLFSQPELDQMMAPIALYPDELLAQLLMAATYPLEVVQAARWSRAHPELRGQDAVRAVENEPWDPSVKAMVAFPQILARMDEDIDWTRDLGDAFLAQQAEVMDTVQALRARAQAAGNLQSDQHVQVVEEEQRIIVRHVYSDVVYVPYYDPFMVYGNWWWPSYYPVRWAPWPGYYPQRRFGLFYWGPGITIGYGFYFGRYDWHHHRVCIVDAPPFYYRRVPPPHRVWVHEHRHRHGVPYRDWRVRERYADNDARPPRGRPGRDERAGHDGRQRTDGDPHARRGQDRARGVQGPVAGTAANHPPAGRQPGRDSVRNAREDVERVVRSNAEAPSGHGDDRGQGRPEASDARAGDRAARGAERNRRIGRDERLAAADSGRDSRRPRSVQEVERGLRERADRQEARATARSERAGSRPVRESSRVLGLGATAPTARVAHEAPAPRRESAGTRSERSRSTARAEPSSPRPDRAQRAARSEGRAAAPSRAERAPRASRSAASSRQSRRHSQRR